MSETEKDSSAPAITDSASVETVTLSGAVCMYDSQRKSPLLLFSITGNPSFCASAVLVAEDTV